MLVDLLKNTWSHCIKRLLRFKYSLSNVSNQENKQFKPALLNRMAILDRVVVLVDMDCFYCQVEEKLDPELEDKPIAVVQYNEWRGGGIIAVNYPARDKGVTRHMRGDDAKEICSDIVLVKVPQVRGKADLSKYRDAGKRVAEVLQEYTTLLERASVDEAYLDITAAVEQRLQDNVSQIDIKNMQNTFVVGCDTNDFIENVRKNREFIENNCKLAMGGVIVEEIRSLVLQKTGYKCSAGIAHNKILAKLACGLHKPNKQTILPQEGVSILYKDLPIRKIKSLGGKFGNTLAEELQITHMGELIQFTENELLKKFDEKTGRWLYNIARGIDLEPVTTRLVPKSIGCCKKFPGKSALIKTEDVEHWISELASEISERLDKDLAENNRRAKQMIISFGQDVNGKIISSSRTQSLNSYELPRIKEDALELVKKLCRKSDGTYHIVFLGISVGHFKENKETTSIISFFKNMEKKKNDIPTSTQSVSSNNSEMHNLTENENIFDNGSDEDTPNNKSSNTIYSASTEELDEDPENLIYFEDIFPENVSSQSILDYVQDKSHTDNHNMLVSTSPQLSDLRKSSSLSFFAKYFQNSHADESSSSKGTDTETSLYQELIQPNQSAVSYVDVEHLEEDCCELCLECNKKIPIAEMISHKDYHLALELSRGKTIARKTSPVNKRSSSDSKTSKKKIKVERNNSVLSLLKDKPELNDSNSEICPLCSRRVRFEDLETHSDYHAAKDLMTQDIVERVEPINRGIKKQINTANSITSFLNKCNKLDETNSIYCSQCHKSIKVEDTEIHKDYHMAKQLNKELNCVVSQSTTKKENIKNKKNYGIGISSFFKPK